MVDCNQMTPEQFQVVVSLLLGKQNNASLYEASDSPETLYRMIESVGNDSSGYSERRRNISYDELLTPAMIPLLLEEAEEPSRWNATALLCTLRKNGQADELDTFLKKENDTFLKERLFPMRNAL